MTSPEIDISLETSDRVYYPGERLSGTYAIAGIEPGRIRAVEVSVLWHTEGKGDEDLQVHDFRRFSFEESTWNELPSPHDFETVLPNSPLSYDGVIVKIRWCVRVRLFQRQGKTIVQQRYFQLGDVPAARALET